MLSLACFVLGIIGGFLVPNLFIELGFIGTIYVNLLKIMIVPVLFTSIICAMTKGKHTGRITLKAIGLFVCMFIICFLISCALVGIVQPGVGFAFEAVPWDGTTTSTTLADFFVSLVPTNILTAMSANSILPTILFAFAFGIAAKKCKVTELFINFLEALNKIFNKMLSWVMKITPIGVFFLIGNTVANYGLDVLKSCAIYIGMAWGISIIICLLVMILPVWIATGLNPWQYIRKAAKVWLITISTCSSAATLPTTIRVCNEDFGVPEEITNITVPLGCTIHMCGGAVSFALLAMFCMQMYGIAMTPAIFFTMLLAATLINMGAPGIPGGGIVIGASYLTLLGIPIDFIGLYAGIYRLLDMVYTTMNVTGDITANVLINRGRVR